MISGRAGAVGAGLRPAPTPEWAGQAPPPLRFESHDRLKLRKASREFEAILIAEWWKSAAAGFKGISDEDETGLKAFGEFGQQAMALAIAQAGGLGLGRMIFDRLEGARGMAVPAMAHGRDARATP